MSGRPALVLLHAFGAAGRSFAPLAERLAERVGGVATHAPDLPGFGGAPALPHPSVGAYVNWVQRHVARQGIARAVLGGWSMGGKIALALAAQRPSWLRGLVLIAPSPPSAEPMSEEDRHAQLQGFGDEALARRSILELAAPSSPRDWVDGAVRERLAVDARTWRWWLEEGSREVVSVRPPVQAPSMIVAGDADPNLGAEVQRTLTAPALAHPAFATLADCGHFAPLERPDALARRIASLPGLPQATPAPPVAP